MIIFTKDEIKRASNLIKSGGIVAFPTETVYGLGADALNSDAVLKIFKAKNRSLKKPLIVLVSSIEMLEKITTEIPSLAFKVIDAFWPGAVTIVLKKNNIIPDITTSSLKNIAVRMPDNEITLSLIKECDVPITGTSANVSGKVSPRTFEEVITQMNNRIDGIIKSDTCKFGIESTIIDFTIYPPKILRKGSVPVKDIMEIIKIS